MAEPAPEHTQVQALPAPVVTKGLDPRIEPWIEEYNTTENDRSGAIYRIAEQAKLGAASADVVTALREVFAREPDSGLKIEVLGHLASIKNTAAVPAIAAALDARESEKVREAAVYHLQFVGTPEVQPFLQKALADPDTKIREAARDALEALDDRR